MAITSLPVQAVLGKSFENNYVLHSAELQKQKVSCLNRDVILPVFSASLH
jgi:hypothetical protein